MSQHKGSLACSSYSQRVGLTTRNLHVDSELTKSVFGPPSNLLETQFSQINHHRNYWKHIVILYCFFFVFFCFFKKLQLPLSGNQTNSSSQRRDFKKLRFLCSYQFIFILILTNEKCLLFVAFSSGSMKKYTPCVV